jgi:hypothetical protein
LIFHVQTEDSGVDNPHIFTHLFHGGVIISSRKMNYDADSDEDVVKSLMQSQHKAVLKDLKIGTFDDKIDAYLGNNPELLPRKTGGAPVKTPAIETPVPEAPAPAAAKAAGKNKDAVAVGLAATEHDLSEASEQAQGLGGDTEDMGAMAQQVAARVAAREAASKGETPTGDTVELSDAARAAQMAAQQKLAAAAAMAEAQAAVQSSAEGSDDTIPVEAPSTKLPRRARVPTPLAVPVAVEKGIGDPVVTFSSKGGEGAGAQSSGGPDAETTGESSGSYHLGRRQVRQRTETGTPIRGRSASPSSGASGNPPQGRPKSSVSVSRPAVIIGGPARVVGGKKTATGGKPRQSKGLFGKDLISEKSLDEVIMAYLSEDANDD